MKEDCCPTQKTENSEKFHFIIVDIYFLFSLYLVKGGFRDITREPKRYQREGDVCIAFFARCTGRLLVLFMKKNSVF